MDNVRLRVRRVDDGEPLAFEFTDRDKPSFAVVMARILDDERVLLQG